MHREHALPAAGGAGENDQAGRLELTGGRQCAGARPVGVAPAARLIADGIDRGAGEDGAEKQREDGEHDGGSAVEWMGGRHGSHLGILSGLKAAGRCRPH
jgi:hypothetical protein